MAQNSLVLRVSADSWSVDPQFTVSVNGKQVGGTYSASASHAAGAWQDVTVTGDFAVDAASVAVTFTNDAYGGDGLDRNLYVQSLTLGGRSGGVATMTGYGNKVDGGVGALLSDGTASFSTAAFVATTPVASKALATTPASATETNTLVLRVSADSWSGDPQFTVTVDGRQIGGTYTASASHAAGAWQDVTVTGDFAANPGSVEVNFTNDAYGGIGEDRNLYVQSLTLGGKSGGVAAVTGDGNTMAGGLGTLLSNGTAHFDIATLVPTAPQSVAPVVPAPVSTANSLVLRVAADSWSGDPQFTVTVDGKQVGGIYTATASHAAGAWQDVTVTGAFATNPASIAVNFVNDAYGGEGKDRNLYVQSLVLGGLGVGPTSVTGDGNAIDGGTATLLSNGTASFSTATLVPVTPPASLVLRVAADSWSGDPQFTVSVDGKQVGNIYTATASHAAGVWQDVTVTGDFTANPASITVNFVNDAYGGAGKDRNLYVQSLTLGGLSGGPTAITGDGNTIAGGVGTLLSNGTASFSTASLVPVTLPSNSLVLRVAADSWSGDPQFTVTVDGKQIGGTYTASASHATGAWQDVTVTGSFGTNPSSVAVNFTNDAYGGWNQDRNLYIQSLTLNGKTFSAANAINTGGSDANGEASLMSNGTLTFNTAASGTSTPVDAGLQLLGVNLAGGEFGAGQTPGTYGTDYTYPTHQEIDYYASKGLNVIRVPFLWERLQQGLNGPLNQTELGRLEDVVDYASAHGLKTILDAHDYGTGFGSDIGTTATPNSAFADFWGKLSSSFASNPNVIYGLMNEPHDQTATSWLGSANAAIAAIRDAGAHQEILVSGTDWDGAWTWTSSDNAAVMGSGVKDPLNNYAFEVHQYLDPDGSGTKAGVSSDTIGADRLASITDWAEGHGAKLFLGEFGVSQDSPSLSALDNMLTFMGQHADVWQGGTYWAGGPWWWGSNIYGIEPDGLGTSAVKDQPQMAILTSHHAT